MISTMLFGCIGVVLLKYVLSPRVRMRLHITTINKSGTYALHFMGVVSTSLKGFFTVVMEP